MSSQMSSAVDGLSRPAAAAAAAPAPQTHGDSDGDIELDSLNGGAERRRGGVDGRRGQRNRRRQPSPGSGSVLRLLSNCFALNKVVCSVCLALVLLLVTVANLALEAVSVSKSSHGSNQTADGGAGTLRVAFQKVMAVVEEGLRKQLPVYIALATKTDMRGSGGGDGGAEESDGNETSREQRLGDS